MEFYGYGFFLQKERRNSRRPGKGASVFFIENSRGGGGGSARGRGPEGPGGCLRRIGEFGGGGGQIFFLGVETSTKMISGPRIADKNFADTRIFLNLFASRHQDASPGPKAQACAARIQAKSPTMTWEALQSKSVRCVRSCQIDAAALALMAGRCGAVWERPKTMTMTKTCEPSDHLQESPGLWARIPKKRLKKSLFRVAPVRFGSVTVWGWKGSIGSGFRFRRFLYKKGFFCVPVHF